MGTGPSVLLELFSTELQKTVFSCIHLQSVYEDVEASLQQTSTSAVLLNAGSLVRNRSRSFPEWCPRLEVYHELRCENVLLPVPTKELLFILALPLVGQALCPHKHQCGQCAVAGARSGLAKCVPHRSLKV